MSSPLKLVRSTNSALDWPLRYVDRGYAVIPVPLRSKNPGLKGWQNLRLTREQVAARFDREPMNIAVLLGEPSGGIVDIDLDHAVAVELAPQFLPPTPAIFGRPGKQRSHWIYRASTPPKPKKFRSAGSETLLEIRSTGQQTVFPPSVHPSGEQIAWVDDNAEPELVDINQLVEAVERLAEAVKARLNEGSAIASPEKQRSGPSEKDRMARCLRYMRRMGVIDGHDGSSRLYAAACRCVEHDLSDVDALTVIRRCEQVLPFPRSWTDREILQRIRDAERKCRRGAAQRPPEVGSDGCIALGERDPESGRVVLSPTKTLPTANAFVIQFYAHDSTPTLISYADNFYTWRRNRYVPVEDAGLRHDLHPWLHDALRYSWNRKTESFDLVDFEANPTSVEAALRSLHSACHVPHSVVAPEWMGGGAGLPDPRDLLPFPAGTLDLRNNKVLAPTPKLFNTNAIEFDFDTAAPQPMQWLAFLDQLFGADDESRQLLQEWIGYTLVADTSQQKMMLVVGPKRSGKGTIGRVMRQLVGAGNIVNPTVSSLAGPFGLQPLIGESLAIVPDARFSGDGVATVVERLLTISGEDAVTIDRKFLPSLSLRLPTRFMFLTNELPKMNDASGALAGRFLMLRLTNSFYGREDTKLTEKLTSELPGILLWAIEGLHRLRERGHFLQPNSVQELLQDMEDLTSPVAAFVREQCILEPNLRVGVQPLYNAWRLWCELNGRSSPIAKEVFCRDLRAAYPQLTLHRNGVNGRFYRGLGLSTEAGDYV